MKKIALLSTIFLIAACGEKTAQNTSNLPQTQQYTGAEPVQAIKIQAAKISQSDREIIEAARNGETNKVRALLETGSASIGAVTEDLETPLIAAASKGHENTVEFLLEKLQEHKAVIDIGDKTGKTALYKATENGFVDIVKDLRSAGANPNVLADDRSAPIHVAANSSKKDLIQALATKSVSPLNLNTVNANGETAIIIATRKNNLEIIGLLKSLGADINLADNTGANPLFHAVMSNDKNLVGFLLQNGADINAINSYGATPLITAISQKNNDMTMHLLIKGANPNTNAKGKPTPLQVAVSQENADQLIVKTLIANGALLASPDMPTGNVISQSVKKGNAEIIKLLLSSGAKLSDLEQPTSSGLTKAMESGDADIATLMIENGANINTLNAEGYSPLALAVKSGSAPLVQLLISKGATANQTSPNPNSEPMKIAMENAVPEVLDVLMKAGSKRSPEMLLAQAVMENKAALIPTIVTNGASADSKDPQKQPLLWIAVNRGSFDAAKQLIALGANPNVQDSVKKSTPLSEAILRGNLEVVVALLNAGANPNLADANGLTSVGYAVLAGSVESIGYLGQVKADFKAKDKAGNTIMQLAEESNLPTEKKAQVIELIKQLGG